MQSSSGSGAESNPPSEAFREPWKPGEDDPSTLLSRILLSAEQAAAISASLRSVAVTLRPQPFSRDPVLRALVRCQLEPLQAFSGDSFEPMCEAVAEAIYDDVEARRRAEQLWSELTNGVADDK
ncbi:MAG: hypothetical protein WCK86_23470 [Planctomycetia bacterium]